MSAAARLWYWGFQSHQGHGYFFVSFDFCQVEVAATGWSLVQRSLTECCAWLSVIYKPREWGGHCPLGGGAAAPKAKKNQALCCNNCCFDISSSQIDTCSCHFFETRRVTQIFNHKPRFFVVINIWINCGCFEQMRESIFFFFMFCWPYI